MVSPLASPAANPLRLDADVLQPQAQATPVSVKRKSASKKKILHAHRKDTVKKVTAGHSFVFSKQKKEISNALVNSIPCPNK